MRATLLLELTFLVTAIWAGGYQGALERVWIFYAYEIDGLNDEGERTIGFACKGQFDSKTGTCPGNNWIACKSKGKRCTFNELVGPLSRLQPGGKVPYGRDADGKPVSGVTSLDAEETAKSLYVNILKATTSKDYPDGYVPSTPAFKMMKGATRNYPKFLSDVGKLVQKTGERGSNLVKHRDLFEGFQKVNALMLDARVGDHGSFLIDEMKSRLQGSGITVKTKDVGKGVNPATGKKWETVDWRTTISDGADDTGETKDAVARIVGSSAAGFYKSSDTANQHKTVIDATRRIDQRMSHCGLS